jgi:hypothetical protein
VQEQLNAYRAACFPIFLDYMGTHYYFHKGPLKQMMRAFTPKLKHGRSMGNKIWKGIFFLYTLIVALLFLNFDGYHEVFSETLERATPFSSIEGKNENDVDEEPPPPPPGAYYAPTVSTSIPSIILSDGATTGGTVLSNGGASIMARGVCWSTGFNPATSSNCTTNGTGTGIFTSIITGLESEQTYHVRAYASNIDPYGNIRVGYGEDIAFKTRPSCPDCSGGLLENATFPEYVDCRCICHKTLIIGPNVTLEAHSSVIIQAPRVIFVNQVHIKKGASLKVKE